MKKFILTSLTRITDLTQTNFEVRPLPKIKWKHADYIAAEVVGHAGGRLQTELTNGRMFDLMHGDKIIGALGERFATLEATGTWKEVREDGIMHLLTGAGLLGKLTSKSFLLPDLIEVKYLGHICRKGQALNMEDFISSVPAETLTLPVVLMVGTSMSAGKTTAGRIVTRLLTNAGLSVVGGKLTGAGRYKDILALQDAGAEAVFDFVDVGLPSSIVDSKVFLPRLRQLITHINRTAADVAVIEIGASPLEPYNGDLAITAIEDQIKCVILCASDPYSVYGVMESFGLKPDLVSGPATNTLAGQALIKTLCQVQPINIIDPLSKATLIHALSEKLELGSLTGDGGLPGPPITE